MKNIVYPLILLAVLAVSCSSNEHLMVQPKSQIDTLYVNVNFSETFDSVANIEIKDGVGNAIERFNKNTNKKFFVKKDHLSSTSSLTLHFNSSLIVDENTQIASFFGTLAGLGLPILMIANELPFFIFFYFNPQNKFEITETLSTDLRLPRYQEPKTYTFQSAAGWFKSQTKTREAAGVNFNYYFYQKLKMIERNALRPIKSS